MEDAEIIKLYHQRNENAISETQKKYESYLMKIAYNILNNLEDSKESVNDTYLKAWNSMPPHVPDILSAFLARITRHTSIDIFRKRKSAKRNDSEYALSLDELIDCVSGKDDLQYSFDSAVLVKTINDFLYSVSEEQKNIFVMRYFFFDSVKKISRATNVSESKVKTTLYRMRESLKEYLKKEGFYI